MAAEKPPERLGFKVSVFNSSQNIYELKPMIFFGDMHISAESLFQIIESTKTRDWPPLVMIQTSQLSFTKLVYAADLLKLLPWSVTLFELKSVGVCHIQYTVQNKTITDDAARATTHVPITVY